ncbi:MAG: hypothetical protein ABI254_05625 [Chthoniobacterales bacterium]
MFSQRSFLVLLLACFALIANVSGAQDLAAAQEQRMNNLEQRMNSFESRTDTKMSSLSSQTRDLASDGGVAFLFAAFCALWAQNTRRSAWLWFFLGLFFNVFAIFVLLWKNFEDRDNRNSGV